MMAWWAQSIILILWPPMTPALFGCLANETGSLQPLWHVISEYRSTHNFFIIFFT